MSEALGTKPRYVNADMHYLVSPLDRNPTSVGLVNDIIQGAYNLRSKYRQNTWGHKNLYTALVVLINLVKPIACKTLMHKGHYDVLAGVHAEVAEAKHEYWSSLAQDPVDRVLAAGQRAKEEKLSGKH